MKLSVLVSMMVILGASTSVAMSLDSEFNKIDANNDGYLSKSEFLQYHQDGINNEQSDPFMIYDTNEDGQITQDEFLGVYDSMGYENEDNGLESRFQKVDADGDGVLSHSELKDFLLENMESDNAEAFNAIDSNKDGRISKKEFDEFFSFAKNLLKM